MKINKNIVNSYVFSLSVFLSAITIPIKVYTSSGLVIWVLYGLLFTISLTANFNSRINKYFIVFIVFFSLFFILSFVFSNSSLYILKLYFDFLKFSILPVFFFQYITKSEELFLSLYKVAKFTYFILIFSIPFIIEDSVNYMTFGVSLTYTLIFIYFNDLRKKQFGMFNFILILVGLCAIFIFGNRMSFVSAALCLFCLKIFFIDIRFVNKLLLLLLCFLIALITTFFLYDILIWIQKFLYSHNVYSYSIQKLIMMLNEGIASSSSGRDVIYSEAITMIYNNMFLPYNLGYYPENNPNGSNYPHNLILDLLLVVGLPGLIILMVVYVRFIWLTLKMKDKELRYFVLIISIYSLLRLSSSGTFWSEPFFWLSFFVYISFQNIVKVKNNHEK